MFTQVSDNMRKEQFSIFKQHVLYLKLYLQGMCKIYIYKNKKVQEIHETFFLLQLKVAQSDSAPSPIVRPSSFMIDNKLIKLRDCSIV